MTAFAHVSAYGAKIGVPTTDAVFFTSDKEGRRAVYKADLKMKGF